VSIINRGKSCFMAALIFSYSFVAISKSCSNCTRGQPKIAIIEAQERATL
jgi:hypothetical protein